MNEHYNPFTDHEPNYVAEYRKKGHPEFSRLLYARNDIEAYAKAEGMCEDDEFLTRVTKLKKGPATDH